MNNRVAVNIKELERDIDLLGNDPLGPLRRQAAPRPQDYAQPQHRQMPMPDYVKHQAGVGQLGAISAEAVVHQWEATARSIEAMGEEIRKIVERCAEIARSAETAVKYVEDTAKAYRDEGAKIFSEVESHALLVQEVTETCEAITRKIAEQAGSA